MKILSAEEMMEMEKEAVAAAVAKGINPFGINFNGAATGNSIPYMSHSQAVAKGMTHTARYTVSRSLDWYYYGHYGEASFKADSNFQTLLNSAIWNKGNFTIKYPIENGVYRPTFIVGENSQDYCRTLNFSVSGGGSSLTVSIPSMRKGEYIIKQSGTVTVTNGYLQISLNSSNSEPHIMAVAVYNG